MGTRQPPSGPVVPDDGEPGTIIRRVLNAHPVGLVAGFSAYCDVGHPAVDFRWVADVDRALQDLRQHRLRRHQPPAHLRERIAL